MLYTKSNMAVNSDNQFIREIECFIDKYTIKQEISSNWKIVWNSVRYTGNESMPYCYQ